MFPPKKLAESMGDRFTLAAGSIEKLDSVSAEWLSRSGQQLRDEGASGGMNLPAILIHQGTHRSPQGIHSQRSTAEAVDAWRKEQEAKQEREIQKIATASGKMSSNPRGAAYERFYESETSFGRKYGAGGIQKEADYGQVSVDRRKLIKDAQKATFNVHSDVMRHLSKPYKWPWANQRSMAMNQENRKPLQNWKGYRKVRGRSECRYQRMCRTLTNKN